MNNDYKNGYVRTEGDVIRLFDTNNEFVANLYYYKDKDREVAYNVFMPEEFYIPAYIDRKTRYLIHNNDLVLTLA